MEAFDWDANNPLNNEQENECNYCGNPCDGSYCSTNCKNADLL